MAKKPRTHLPLQFQVHSGQGRVVQDQLIMLELNSGTSSEHFQEIILRIEPSDGGIIGLDPSGSGRRN